MPLSGNLTTRATNGTVSACSKPPMPPVVRPAGIETPKNHSADLRTVQVRMGVYSVTLTLTSLTGIASDFIYVPLIVVGKSYFLE